MVHSDNSSREAGRQRFHRHSPLCRDKHSLEAEWQRRKEECKGEECEWCHKTKYLAVHHRVDFPPEKLKERIIQRYVVYKEPTVAPLMAHVSPNGQPPKVSLNKDSQSIVDTVWEELIGSVEEKYYAMENVITLCRRCHYALHHGMILCEYCKERYHLLQYPSCYPCLKIADPLRYQAIINRRSLDAAIDDAFAKLFPRGASKGVPGR